MGKKPKSDPRVRAVQQALIDLLEEYEDLPGAEHLEDAQGAMEAFSDAQRTAQELDE